MHVRRAMTGTGFLLPLGTDRPLHGKAGVTPVETALQEHACGPWIREEAQAGSAGKAACPGHPLGAGVPSVFPLVTRTLPGMELSWPSPFWASHEIPQALERFLHLRNGMILAALQDVRKSCKAPGRLEGVHKCLPRGKMGSHASLLLILAPNASSLLTQAPSPHAWRPGACRTREAGGKGQRTIVQRGCPSGPLQAARRPATRA